MDPSLTEFFQSYSLRKFKRGQTILFQGEVPRCAYVVMHGIIRTYNISSSGEEQIISLSSQYDILPEAWFLGEATVAYYFYEAFTDCEVYLIPREELINAIHTNPDLTDQVLRRFMKLYVGARVHINALEQPRSHDKLVHLLHYLMMRFGEDRSNGWVRLRLRLTHQILANMLGVTRETIATEISHLRKCNVLRYRQQMYSINRAGLMRQRNEDDLIEKL